MNLIETYASSCGLQIDKPEIYAKYFPMPFDKYVIVHAGAGSGARRYEYYGEVISLIKPILSKLGYEIVQIGARNDHFVPGVVDLRGATSIHQTAYLIQNAALFIGNDSCNMHIASGYDIPIVALFSTVYPHISRPYFSSPEKTRLIMGDLKGEKPSYAFEEADKVINRIKPEEIAQAALDLLGVDEKLSRETVFFGKQYAIYNIDLVPDCILSPEIFKECIPSIRMDFKFDEDFLVRNLQARQYHIVTNKPISHDLLKFMKPNIKALVYQIEEGYSVDFVDSVRRAGVSYILYTLLEGEALAKAKLDFFDFGIIKEGRKKGAEILEKYPNITKESKYRTNKFLLSSDKIYLNKIRWQEDKPVPDFSQNVDTVSLNPEFFDYSEHFYVFNE